MFTMSALLSVCIWKPKYTRVCKYKNLRDLPDFSRNNVVIKYQKKLIFQIKNIFFKSSLKYKEWGDVFGSLTLFWIHFQCEYLKWRTSAWSKKQQITFFVYICPISVTFPFFLLINEACHLNIPLPKEFLRSTPYHSQQSSINKWKETNCDTGAEISNKAESDTCRYPFWVTKENERVEMGYCGQSCSFGAL